MKTEFKCPSGHTVQATDLHSYIKLDMDEMDDAIIFDCPGGKRGHIFTLRKAVAAGMFSSEEAARLSRDGRIKQAESRKEAAKI